MKRWISSLLLIFLFGFPKLSAQSTIGTEFWVAYMENLNLQFNDAPIFTLYVDATQTTEVTVEVPQTGLVLNFTAAANSVTPFTLPAAVWYTETSEVIDNKAIKVTSDQPIQLYTVHFRTYFSESTQVLPITELGTDYLLNCYKDDFQNPSSPSSFVIVSTAEDTEVEITPAAFTQGLHPAGVPFTITLDEGQNYAVQAAEDLSGSRVRSLSGQPIAVFSGAQQGNIETCGGADSHIYDQALPIQRWGEEYYYVPFSGQGGDVVRILASQDDTQLYFDCQPEVVLNAGEYYTTKLQTATIINAANPIAVAQFNSSQECNASGIGDPNMLQLFPTEYQGFAARFDAMGNANAVSSTYFQVHFVNVVTASSEVGALSLDGSPVAGQFSPFPGNTDYSFAQLEVDPGTHILESSAPFAAYSYGFGDFDAYTHNLGYAATQAVDFVCLDIEADGLFCVDSLINFSVTTNQEVLTYEWDFANTQTAGGMIANTTYSTPGIYTITVTATLANGSTIENSIDIEIFDCPSDPCLNPVSVVLAYAGELCQEPLLFSYSSDSTFTNVEWDFGNGIVSTEQSPAIELSGPAIYTIQFTASDAFNCSYEAMLELEVPNCGDPCFLAGEVPILVEGTFCVDSVLTFSTPIDPDLGVFGDWIFSDGQTFFSNSVTLIFSEPGDYVVEFFGFDFINGCDYFGGLEFTIDDNCVVDPCDDLPDLQLQVVGQFCVDSTLEFSYTNGNLVSYEWNFGGTLFTTPTVALEYSVPGVYGFTFTGVDINGCTYTDHQFFDIGDCGIDPCDNLPSVIIQAGGDFCVDSLLEFSVQTLASLQFYQWDFGNGLLSIEANPAIIYEEVGVFQVVLNATDVNGCTYQVEQPLVIEDCSSDPCLDLEAVGIEITGARCAGESLLLSYTTSAELFSEVWLLNGQEFGMGPSVVFEPAFQGLYAFTFEAIDADGCTYFRSINLLIDICEPEEVCELYFPNIFSPNGDGSNDTFRALYNCPPAIYSLQIYNRWGGLIFETQNPESFWDGRLNGRDMPSDVYAYLVEYRLPDSAEVQVEYGDLTLVR